MSAPQTVDLRHPPEAARWAKLLSDFVPGFMANHPVLASVGARGDLILSGSTSFGIDDEYSDLDVDLLLSHEDLAVVDSASPTRYFDFTLDGKQGSILVQESDNWASRIDTRDMPLISELRTAIMLSESTGNAEVLVARALQPMRRKVRDALFFNHHFEMRSFHRSADNPMNRGDAVAAHLNSAQALAHGLRACLCWTASPTRTTNGCGAPRLAHRPAVPLHPT